MGFETRDPHLSGLLAPESNYFPLYQHLPLEYCLSEWQAGQAAGSAFGYSLGNDQRYKFTGSDPSLLNQRSW